MKQWNNTGMKFPKEFEKYWNNSQCKRDTLNNVTDKKYAYLAWAAGRKFGRKEISHAGPALHPYGLQMGD